MIKAAFLRMLWILVTAAVALVVLWGWYSSGLVISAPRLPITILPGAFGLRFESVQVRTEDGVPLEGWFVPAPSPSDTTLILCHGWGANRSDILPSTHFLALRGGYNLFYFDFRNHGESGGRRGSLTLLESRDLEACIRYLKQARPTEARRVGVYGLSMGGAVAILTAARLTEIEAVAAESPFSSFNDAVARFAKIFYNIPRACVPYTLWIVRARLGFDPDRYSPIRFVDKIAPRPLFLLQGANDVRMPPAEGEKLFAAAGQPKSLWTVPGADHGEPWQAAGKEYEDRLLEFFQQVFKRI